MTDHRNPSLRILTRFAGALAGVATLAATALVAKPAAAQEPAACLSMDPSQWPSPSRPYFMVIVDNSGSMGSQVTTANSCGYESTRIGHARCALKNTVSAFAGEVNFGVATYAWRLNCPAGTYTCANCNCGSTNCSSFCFPNAGCSAQYTPADNNFCGPLINEPTLGANVHNGGLVAVPLLQDHYWSTPPDPSNVPAILNIVDNNCGNGEIGSSSNTPLGGTLFSMNRYLSGIYTDPFTGTALPTPIGPSPQERACRPVNIILITDGDETCDGYNLGTYPNGEGLAVYEAGRLFNTGVTVSAQNFKIRTYVIGFAGATMSALNNIAAAGGTGTAYSTSNEAQLSQALANIVAASIKPESCDNTDNNCNGCTDEGYKHYCDTGQTCCAWTTQAQRGSLATASCTCANGSACSPPCAAGQVCQANACVPSPTSCYGQYLASITPANPSGDLTKLPCTTPTQQTQPASWLCYDPKESCDNIDNNCNGTTDEGVTKCGSPLHCPVAETCNGQDDNCDGIVDNATGSGVPYSACPNNCQSSPEICDGCDNDCDGIADNGVAPVPCGFTTPPNCAGTKACLSTGVAVPVGGCVGAGVPKGFSTTCNNNPQTEICDGLDNNCNGTIDEGIPPTACVPAGTPGGLVYKSTFPASQCVQGTQPCNGTCTGFIGPSAEVCDGIDNDCNGIVDDNVPGVNQPCGVSGGICVKGLTACVGGFLVCQGGVQPQPESCNGIDDDCNGKVDDGALTDQPPSSGCWNLPATGCSPVCNYKNLSWCAPAGATCNGIGTLTDPCQTGTLVCDGLNGWKCQGGKAPTAEVCDGVDNNCNGQVDDNLTGLGQPCGNTTAPCTPGTTVCNAGKIDCQGGTQPKPEVCNGIDDDCNGKIDDGLGLGGACAPTYDTTLYPGDRTKGQCKPGVQACDTGGSGKTVCVGGVGPQPEICDGIDNDCDGQIDEPGPAPDGINGTANPSDPNQHIGDACGVDVGECKKGQLTCDNGKFICAGAVGPQPETCDCKDNNCNGQIDENNPPTDGGGALPICNSGKTCVEVNAGLCQCAVACKGEICPGGTTCQNVTQSGTTQKGDYCVYDPCGDCSTKTVKDTTGKIECGPAGSGANIPVCMCKGDLGCKSPCSGVTCPAGQACAPSGPAVGTCQPQNDCFFFGCNAGEVCNNGTCVKDPCTPNPCKPDEVCKPNTSFGEPRCVKSCAGVSCKTTEKCVEGVCNPSCDPACSGGQVCVTVSDAGSSCGPDKCQTDAGLACSNGAYCDPATGSCGNDPCTGVKCPTAQVCVAGECQWAPEGGTGGAGGTAGTGGSAGTGGKDGGAAAGGTSGSGTGAQAGSEQKGVWGLATGGGGCACRTTGSRDRTTPLALGLLGLAIGAAVSRRRKKSQERSPKKGGER